MRENDFNLVTEPWIQVRGMDASLQEVSMLELFRNAHNYQALAGEVPTQDAAILRFLLAVLHTVFSRFNEDGEEELLEEAETEDDGLDRWEALWNKGRFSIQPIEEYLRRWQHKFWLFDEEYPFYQNPAVRKMVSKCPQFQVSKLNAAINQSGNKARIFSSQSGKNKEQLCFPEAARWLIHLIAYDDSSLKPTKSCKTGMSPGLGWLGKMDVVYAEGNNLFETLMLNLVVLPNGEYGNGGQPFYKQKPRWEDDNDVVREREKINFPDNMAQLLTIPSRYVSMVREGENVTGYCNVSGVFFDEEIPLEQMTRRNGRKNRKKSPYAILKSDDAGRFLWQEFSSLLTAGTDGDDSRPGVVRWIGRLQNTADALIDPKRMIRFTSVNIFYDTKKSSIEQIQSDTLSLHADLLSELAQDWRKMITEEVTYTDQTAWKVGRLARDLEVAASGATLKKGKIAESSQMQAAAEKAMAAFYDAMDLPFREWLCSISALDQDREEKRSQWRALARQKAQELGGTLAHQAGPAAYRGHIITEEGKAAVTYATPALYGIFCAKLKN